MTEPSQVMLNWMGRECMKPIPDNSLYLYPATSDYIAQLHATMTGKNGRLYKNCDTDSIWVGMPDGTVIEGMIPIVPSNPTWTLFKDAVVTHESDANIVWSPSGYGYTISKTSQTWTGLSRVTAIDSVPVVWNRPEAKTLEIIIRMYPPVIDHSSFIGFVDTSLPVDQNSAQQHLQCAVRIGAYGLAQHEIDTLKGKHFNGDPDWTWTITPTAYPQEGVFYAVRFTRIGPSEGFDMFCVDEVDESDFDNVLSTLIPPTPTDNQANDTPLALVIVPRGTDPQPFELVAMRE